MSRIGKQPINVPEKVEVKIDGQNIKVKGPKGELEHTFNGLIKIDLADKVVSVNAADESKKSRAMWGTGRAVISNMVQGVSVGFERDLEFNGVGYKAVVKGKKLVLNLGYSHPINYDLPEGVTAKVERNTIKLSCCSKELVGFVAAKIRSFRPPEPYKGKGVKYVEEVIIRKAGKTGAK